MSNESLAKNLELKGDFDLYTYASAAAQQLNCLEVQVERIVVRVDNEKTEQDSSLEEGHQHFVVEGIRKGMMARFQRTLAEIKESTPRSPLVGDL